MERVAFVVGNLTISKDTSCNFFPLIITLYLSLSVAAYLFLRLISHPIAHTFLILYVYITPGADGLGRRGRVRRVYKTINLSYGK